MYRKKTSSQLKQVARGLMIGKYRNAITVLLGYELILSTLTLLTAPTSTSLIGSIFGFIINFIIVLLGSILQVGQFSFYLNIACEQPYQLSDLFTGFKIHPDKIIITRLISSFLTTLPLIPALVVMIIAVYSHNMITILFIGCMLLILGSILSWWIGLRFSQVHYLLLDFPEYSSRELLKMSWKLMKGNTGRLFYIQVSFLPLMLAGLLSFGIGLLFITPYQSMTHALFYLDIIQSKNI